MEIFLVILFCALAVYGLAVGGVTFWFLHEMKRLDREYEGVHENLTEL